MRKGFAAFFLAFCLLAPLATSWFVLKVQKKAVRKAVKHQMIEGIDEEALVLLGFTNEEAEALEWEHSKEFEYNDAMYDVVRQETTSDSVFYWCWPDREETELNKALHSLVVSLWQQNPDRKENDKKIHTFYKDLVPPSFVHIAYTPPLQLGIIPALQEAYSSRRESPPTPPPQG